MRLRKIAYRLFALLLVAGMFLGFIQPDEALATRSGSPALADPLSKIEPLVLEEIQAEGQTEFFIWMTEKADLSPAYQLQTKQEKGQFVYQTLVETAERTQRAVRAYLDVMGVDYQAFYIANKILVRSGGLDLLMTLAARPDIAQITANHKYQLEAPIQGKPQAAPQAVEPNITFIKADQVWALGYNGSGTVMAGNDTGLDETHPTIAPHYRGCLNPPSCTSWDHNYNWWDATDTYPTNPDDGFGHGTHTTGTMVGDDGGSNQIGVAPGAQTIHCKNMTDGGSGNDATFTECFQWDLAPWDLNGLNPRPDLAPDAVNNSWGYGGGGAPQFRDEIQALHAAGILIEASAGNEGPSCQTLRSPGDYWETLTTGSVNHAAPFPGTITGFSSRGPSDLDGNYFPDIMAPGENVRSALPGGGYDYWSGTSMAGPHTTALVGLMWSACPALRGMVYPTIDMILQTAAPLTGQSGSNCGGDYTVGPNNDWGYGTIDALAAVSLAVAQCTGVGTLTGTVSDAATSDPIVGASVLAEWEGGFSWTDLTDITGTYSVVVPTGTYTVTASAFGYYSDTVTSVEVFSDTVTVVDFALDALPTYVISGTVTDAVSGDPLPATITVLGTPISPVSADPQTGYYSVTVPAGVYDLRAASLGYLSEVRQVVADQDQTQNFALEPKPCILLVDDDQNNPDVRSSYTNALNNLGYEYVIWDIGNDGDPTADDLFGYRIVIWFNGYPWNNTFNSSNEQAVADFLDSGGNFFFSSQDYLYEFDLTPFGMNYLKIGSYASDVEQTQVTGQNVFAGLGPYFLSYPFNNYSDLVNPGTGGQVAFMGDMGSAAVSYDGPIFNTVFLGYPFETISSLSDRVAVLGRAIEFFGGCPVCEPVELQSLTSNSPVILGETMYFTAGVIGTEPISYTWDFGGSGAPGGTDPNPTYLYDAVGTYTVTLEVANACGVDSGELRVEVLEPLPDIVVAPLLFDLNLDPGETSTEALNIANQGSLDLNWALAEAPAVDWLSAEPLSGTLAPNESSGVNLIFDASALTPGVYTTTLEVSSNDPDDPLVIVAVNLTVNSVADLSLSKVAEPDVMEPGGVLTYTLTVVNNGPMTAVNVLLTDTLPAGVTFVSATAPCVESGGVVTCALGDLGNGESVEIVIVVLAPDVEGVITNTAEVTSETSDPEPGNNLASAETTVMVQEYFILLPMIHKN